VQARLSGVPQVADGPHVRVGARGWAGRAASSGGRRRSAALDWRGRDRPPACSSTSADAASIAKLDPSSNQHELVFITDQGFVDARLWHAGPGSPRAEPRA
jgi:hypothetical protein